MITNGNTPISVINIGRRAISAVYSGSRLVWQAISNCIAGGWWQHSHGWMYGTGWNERNSNR
ncbi:MAG: MFS transporter [Muribaculaceae bacterium]|nr:MFS transporter [Muribaculaceae bacterium]